MAKRLEGRPFHLIASYCQTHQTKEQVAAYLKSKGLPANPSNFTVSNQTRHPKVRGNGYVPYYVVFDHEGKIAHHHMCGDYHGGDGLKMIEWVDKLLDAAPDVYLGKEPFGSAEKLAKQIRGRKKLGSALKAIERKLGSDSTKEEERADHARLLKAVEAWLEKRFVSLDDKLASSPSEVADEYKKLKKEFRGSSLAETVEQRAESVVSSESFKKSLAIEKKLGAIDKKMRALKPCKECKRSGMKAMRSDCPSCQRANRKRIASLRKKLEALDKDADGLPIRSRIRNLLASAQ